MLRKHALKTDEYTLPFGDDYTGCIKKKLNRFEIALNFEKQPLVSSF